MLSPAVESKTRKLLFLDFDWAGAEGETWYPMQLHHVVFKNGAQPGGLITHEHDVAMVDSWEL